MTTVIDRLEAAGYVARSRHGRPAAHDVELTDEARRRSGRCGARSPRRPGKQFAAYDEEQLRFLRDFLQDAVEFRDRHRERRWGRSERG